MTTSVTGVAAPSLDARLVGRLGLRADVKRVPIFGLGCVAGAAGLARLHDYLPGHPDDVAVLLSVELCSLTFQRDDDSTANLVASGLFGDGATAVVMVGERRAARIGPGAARASSTPAAGSTPTPSASWAGTSAAAASGSCSPPTVADVVQQYLGDDVEAFLADHDLKTADVDTWVAHPGGPKVHRRDRRGARPRPERARRDAAQPRRHRQPLVVVGAARARADAGRRACPPPGTPGVLMAMGPGFCAELVLLRW